MGSQLSLPLQLGPRVVVPDARRAEPALWIRSLAVLRELKTGDEHVVRRIALRRGLNILWAPPSPPAAGAPNRLFEGRLTGHTAGKTTFCRFIRHLLGEPHFGAASLCERIRARFPHGWIVGEVVVGGELWTVGRPFAIGAHPFAAQGMPIEIALEQRGARGAYDAFLAAVDTAVIWPLPVRRLPASDQGLRWEHLLPWLARDQEARFARLVEWRDAASESESPKLTMDDRFVVVRAVLDLISDDERAEQKRSAGLLAEKEELEASAPLLSHQVDVDRTRLATLLGTDVRGSEGPLFGDDPRSAIEVRRAALAMTEQETAGGDEVDRHRSMWERAVEARVMAEARLRAIEARGAPIAVTPGRGVCNVPIAIAVAEGCPLATRAHGHDAAASPEAIVREAAEAREALAAARDEERAAHEALGRAEAERRAANARIAKEREVLDRAAWLASELDEGRLRVEVDAERLARIEKEIRRSYERQEALRKRRAAALGQISERFDHVVRAIMGQGVGGRVEDDGRHLSLRIEEHGERDSAALATIRLLAFDLAALTASVEGHGFFPRFLLHDGPREADLDQRIYERLFLYARSIEDRSRAEPGFQYIVTTTAPPPEALAKAPWLLTPTLDASTPEGRLLRVDL